jgi:lipid II:glycine glycyltransferase (peptidoglycan interpeptide bridge formation enzyme)
LENGKLQALVPVMQVNSFLTGKRGVSIPFTDYSDAIINNGISFKNLFDQLTQYGENHGWKSFELRGGQSLPLLSETSSTYSRHILNLSENEDEIFSGFKASTRRNIKRAIKKGGKVEVCRTLDSIQEFHRLNCMTRKRHGLPPQPFHFFQKVYEHIISQKLGFVVLASYEKTFVAGAVFFHFGENAFFKYGASDKNFHYLRPNNLIMWEAIKWFSKNGYKSICFGRTEPENKGLRRFKAGWGAKEGEEKYYKYDLKKGSFVSGSSRVSGFHNKIFRNMPLPILKKVGSILYKHVG